MTEDKLQRERTVRGMATHAGLHLMTTDPYAWRGAQRKLKRLLRHKVDAVVVDRQQRHRSVELYLRQHVTHQDWVAACCGQLAAVLQAYGVTAIYGVEQRLPPVVLADGTTLDAGEMDLIGYSKKLGGAVAFEVKTRYKEALAKLEWGKAVRNARGLEQWLAARELPLLKEVVWVFLVPHADYPKVPLLLQRPMHYDPVAVQTALDAKLRLVA